LLYIVVSGLARRVSAAGNNFNPLRVANADYSVKDAVGIVNFTAPTVTNPSQRFRSAYAIIAISLFTNIVGLS
jgi:hypothetical protein